MPRCLLPFPGSEEVEYVTPPDQCRPDGPPPPRREKLVSLSQPSGFKNFQDCQVCKSAVAGPPHERPNYRLNPSLLIRYKTVDKDTGRIHVNTYQIDAGKTFREAALRWYPRNEIACLDALILTHEHADACFGLDDIRGFQVGKKGALPVYCSRRDLDSLERRFDYLMPGFMQDKSVKRWVSQLDFNVIEPYKAFTLPGGLKIMPVMVWHGEDYECMGFMFGEHERIAYLSDVSRIPEATDVMLRGGPVPGSTGDEGPRENGQSNGNGTSGDDDRFLDLLIVDCLFMDREHPTHFNFHQSMACIRSLRPKRALLVGMSHDFDYDSVNERLRTEREVLCGGADVMMARDGLSLDVYL